MADAFAHVNWLAVIIAVIAYFVLGGIWFPLIVKGAYIRALESEMRSGALSLIGPLCYITVTTITCAILIRLLGVTRLQIQSVS